MGCLIRFKTQESGYSIDKEKRKPQSELCKWICGSLAGVARASAGVGWPGLLLRLQKSGDQCKTASEDGSKWGLWSGKYKYGRNELASFKEKKNCLQVCKRWGQRWGNELTCRGWAGKKSYIQVQQGKLRRWFFQWWGEVDSMLHCLAEESLRVPWSQGWEVFYWIFILFYFLKQARQRSLRNGLGLGGHVSVQEDGLSDCVTPPLVLLAWLSGSLASAVLGLLLCKEVF